MSSNILTQFVTIADPYLSSRWTRLRPHSPGQGPLSAACTCPVAVATHSPTPADPRMSAKILADRQPS